MLAWELVGAVIGAGLASGREIASFFARYGTWGCLGILAAVAVMTALSDTFIPLRWQGRWPAALWKTLLSLLLIATGGAMLSGAGEIASLTLPFQGAYWLGMGVTLLLAWLLAQRTLHGLAWVSRGLLAVLTVLIFLGFMLPPMQAVPVSEMHPSAAILRAVTYGGFNAAIQVPIVLQAAEMSQREKKCAIRTAGLLILLVLMLGNAVLMRHSALLGEAMPFVRMLSSLGKAGYTLGAFSLYLSILSTLTACLRGLSGRCWCLAAIVSAALFGFSGVVDTLYPLLGGGCLVMLAAAKLTNCYSRPFHSQRDMI